MFKTHETFEAVAAVRPGRVLVAEDNLQMRALVVRGLQRAGFNVVGAGNGVEALGLLADSLCGGEDERFDLIISDLRMPGLDGMQLLACARHDGVVLPVIVITAFGTPETHAKAHELGAFAVFDKPLEIEDLVIAALAAATRLA